MNIRDFFDLTLLEDVMQEWSKATGMATIAMDNEDQYLTGEIGFTDFCTKYTRGTKEGLRRCIMSDACNDGVYYCHAGLMDFSVEICLDDGTRLGKIIGGQILPKKPEPEKFKRLASELGIDEDEYMEALSKINIRSKEAIEASAYLLGRVVNLLVNSEYTKKSQERMISQLGKENKLDALTRIYNKSVLQPAVEEKIYEGRPFALVMLDVDDFKNINDTYGHMTGDYVLKTLAWKIKDNFRSSDIVGRFGGDEFYAILDLERKGAIDIFGRKLCELAKNIHPSGVGETVTVSVGMAISPEHGTDYDTLLENADKALYESKNRGKNCYSVYSAGDAN